MLNRYGLLYGEKDGGTLCGAAGPAVRATYPESLGTTPARHSIWPRQLNKPVELFVVHNTELAAPGANWFIQHRKHFRRFQGRPMDQLRTASSAAARGGGACRCARNKTKTAPPFLRRKDRSPPQRKPLPRMDNGFSCFQMYEKKIFLALVIVSVMEYPAVAVHII